MPEFVTLSIDTKLPADTFEAVLSELRDAQPVESVRPLQQRALEPHSIMALIQVASGVLSAATSAWTLIDKIRKTLHSKNVIGAHVILPNGTRIEIDRIDEEQLGQLIGGTNRNSQPT